MQDQKYEVVCSEHYYDVGLLIEKDYKLRPKRVLARNYGTQDAEFGGVEFVNWINTGIFLSEKEWNEITYNKSTQRIIDYLGIERKATMAKKVINGLEVNGENIITSLKIIKQVCEDNRATNGSYCPFNVDKDCNHECTCGIVDLEPDNWKVLEYTRFQALG